MEKHLNTRAGWMIAGLVLLCVTTVQAAEEDDAIVLTAEDIRDMKANKMADVLNHIPGVTAGDSSVGIHGSYKVKVILDGSPINDPSSSYGAVNWDMISPDNVERIEILRGKGGLKYGQDAGGGVILITTRRIRHLSGNVKAYAGNHNTRYSHANMQMTAERLGVSVNAGLESTDGYNINSDDRRRQAGAKLVYTLDAGKAFSFSVDHLEDERGQSGLPDFPTPFARKQSHATNLSTQARFRDVTGNIYYNEGYQHNTDTSKKLDQILRVTELGQNLAGSTSAGNWGELNYGGGYLLGKATGSLFDDQQEETFSAFASESLQWPNLCMGLTFGLRANINSAFDDALNPEIKAIYKKERWRLTAAYSRVNNTPSFHQRYNQTSSTRPNPGLNMETADNFNLALFVQAHATLSASTSVFYNRIGDRITYVTGDDGVGQYQNFGEVTYTGGDLAVSWHPLEPITIKGSTTYLEAKDQETGLMLPAKARHQATLDIYWQPTDALSTVLTTKTVSEVYRDKNNTQTVPGCTLAGVRAEYAFTRFSLFAEIENLFDKTYYYTDGYLGPPLTFLVGVIWRI